MKAVDTNVLVPATMRTHPRHAAAGRLLADLAAGPEPWAIPWPCVYEYLRIVTHPRVFDPPLSPLEAWTVIEALRECPGLQLLAQTTRHASILEGLLAEARPTGNLIFDAQVAALCLEHGVSELLTADRDFMRFSRLRSRDPFTAGR